MRADPRFLNLHPRFWANVRAVSESLGYTHKGHVQVPTLEAITKAYLTLGLRTDLLGTDSRPTQLATDLLAYYEHRASALNDYVLPRLMTAEQAKEMFKTLRARLRPTCPIPMNKQRGKKKAPAYLTAIVNMIVESHSSGKDCDYDPRRLTTVTADGEPVRTLARRIDGAFPSAVNPLAVWEIKEYYYTTTFGSRVADGVYETLLDGMELSELREHEDIRVKHYLIVDGKYTWWDCGRSYLCRIVDMLHMGYVDEVLFGREVPERLPAIVQEWLADLD